MDTYGTCMTDGHNFQESTLGKPLGVVYDVSAKVEEVNLFCTKCGGVKTLIRTKGEDAKHE